MIFNLDINRCKISKINDKNSTLGKFPNLRFFTRFFIKIYRSLCKISAFRLFKSWQPGPISSSLVSYESFHMNHSSFSRPTLPHALTPNSPESLAFVQQSSVVVISHLSSPNSMLAERSCTASKFSAYSWPSSPLS
jgi:hypothetical protein